MRSGRRAACRAGRGGRGHATGSAARAPPGPVGPVGPAWALGPRPERLIERPAGRGWLAGWLGSAVLVLLPRPAQAPQAPQAPQAGAPVRPSRASHASQPRCPVRREAARPRAKTLFAPPSPSWAATADSLVRSSAGPYWTTWQREEEGWHFGHGVFTLDFPHPLNATKLVTGSLPSFKLHQKNFRKKKNIKN